MAHDRLPSSLQADRVAKKCKHCGESLDPVLRATTAASAITHSIVHHQVVGPKSNPGIAAILSLVIPGAGQMYKGNVASGILWLIRVGIGYCLLILPGLILHRFFIFAAASGCTIK
jgi:TM2 domain-containing membrane protein YozV